MRGFLTRVEQQRGVSGIGSRTSSEIDGWFVFARAGANWASLVSRVNLERGNRSTDVSVKQRWGLEKECGMRTNKIT